MLSHGIGSIGIHKVKRVIASEPEELPGGSYTSTLKIQFEIPEHIQGSEEKFEGEIDVTLFFKTLPGTWQNDIIYEV